MPEGSERIPETQQSEGFAQFLRTGQRAAGEFHCSRCGYGVIVQVELPRCPMCSGTAWEPPSWGALRRRTPDRLQ
jgi:rubrerythrin